MSKTLHVGAFIVGSLIGLAVAWALLFVGAIAVGGIASLAMPIALIPNALLFANYGAGLSALWALISVILFGVNEFE